jgi:hypothetical protein
MQGGRVSRGSKGGCNPPHDVRIPLSLAVWWIDCRLNWVASCLTSLWVRFYGLPFLRKTTKNAARHFGQRTGDNARAMAGRGYTPPRSVLHARQCPALAAALRGPSMAPVIPAHLFQKKNPPTRTRRGKKSSSIVRVLASQGDEIALSYALNRHRLFDQLVVSPRLRGSNPYPCGSLTYRFPVPV